MHIKIEAGYLLSGTLWKHTSPLP